MRRWIAEMLRRLILWIEPPPREPVISRVARDRAFSEGKAGRWLACITSTHVVERPLPAAPFTSAVGIVHKIGGVVAMLVLTRGEETWILDEVEAGSQTSVEDAAVILAMLERNHLTPSQVDHWVGDQENASSYWGSAKSNQDLRAAILSMAGLDPKAAPRIETPRHSANGLRRRVAVLNNAANKQHLWVHPRCHSFIQAVNEWCGEGSALCAYVQACTYAMMAHPLHGVGR